MVLSLSAGKDLSWLSCPMSGKAGYGAGGDYSAEIRLSFLLFPPMSWLFAIAESRWFLVSFRGHHLQDLKVEDFSSLLGDSCRI